MNLKDIFKRVAVNYLRHRAMGGEFSPRIFSALSVAARFFAPEAVPFLSAMAAIAKISGPIEKKFFNDLADRIERGEDLNITQLLSEAFNDLRDDIDQIIPEIEKISPEAADFIRKLFGKEGEAVVSNSAASRPLQLQLAT